MFCGYGSPKICQVHVYIQWVGAEEGVCVCVCVFVCASPRLWLCARADDPIEIPKIYKSDFRTGQFSKYAPA